MTIRRPELLDEPTRRFLNLFLASQEAPIRSRRCASSGHPLIRRERAAVPASRTGPSRDGHLDVEALAEELLKCPLGTHSLGLFYEFFRKTRDPADAKAEFIRFLAGEWSQSWVEAAALDVSEQQRAPRKPVCVPAGNDAPPVDGAESGLSGQRPSGSAVPER